MEGFPPIAEYGFLSDCHTGALVAADGSVEWMCLPRFDSPSVFGALLDRGAGSFRLGPVQQRVPVARRYEPGTNMVETTWMTRTGWVVVRDALVIGQERLLVRTAECTYGKVELEALCEPVFDYGKRPARWSNGADGALEATDGPVTLRLAADFALHAEAGIARGACTLAEGETSFCALSGGHAALPGDAAEAAAILQRTCEYWRAWLAAGRFPDHPWRIHLQRSAITLKGLSYEPTGAFVAALTTSLPETPGGERNWDYRYTWIRDATFALWGMHTLGFDDEARDFMRFVAKVCREEGAEAQIMYGIGGEKRLTEQRLEHLGGYGGARPVRIGNAAYEQRQNDVYGALLDSVYIHSKARDDVPKLLWQVIHDQVEAAAKVWHRPDQGIWEARGDPRHYVSSKLMCWVALDRGARLARRRDEDAQAARWAEIAAEIRADILARGVSERGVFRQHYETDALDASTLLVPLVRFLPHDDERVRATVLAIADELTEGGLVLRYRVDETDDGQSGVEGTFTMCSFWLVSALSEIGEAERAWALCQRLLAAAGELRLYAEELDAESNLHLGNFPQAFTHLALINAVSHVIADDLAPGRKLPRGIFGELRNA